MPYNTFDSTLYFYSLFVLLLVLVPLYALVTRPLWRRLIFTLTGCYLLWLIAPRLLLFYSLLWVLVAWLQRLVYWSAEKPHGLAVFWLVLLTCLAPMAAWKFLGEPFVAYFNLATNGLLAYFPGYLWEIDTARDILIPIGLSFATFRALDLLIKTYVGRQGILSIEEVLFYGFFPPVQVVGPIIEYEEIQQHGAKSAPLKPDDALYGVLRIAWGLFKILFVASILEGSGAVFSNYPTESMATLWVGLVAYTWYFYINFSAYSDLAIGFSRIFGFRLKENFANPYFSRNIAEFWNSWHMSLSRFAQRNVFVPVGGFRKERQYIALFLTMMTIALWHDISLNMVAFGLYHAAALMIQRVWSSRFQLSGSASRMLAPVFVLMTFLTATLGLPMLVLPLDTAMEFYNALLLGAG